MDLFALKEKYNYAEATQVMRQYLDIKFANIDCLVLFRMGDFYELFYEDATTAGRILGIALTRRGKPGENEISMCGVPHHALLNYLTKLLAEGFKVAICDQTETPEEAKRRGGYKAVVNRSVTRIITPGTVLEEALLEAGAPNYLISIAPEGKSASIAAVDLSTSEISVITIPESEIINEVVKLAPKEILLGEKYRNSDIESKISEQLNIRISFLVDSFYAFAKCKKIILEFYKINDLSSVGNLDNSAVAAIGTILEYISLTQKNNIPQLQKPKILSYFKIMSIDASTRRNLEITNSLKGAKNSLFSCINNTVTKSGSRLLYQHLLNPLLDVNAINKRLDVTEFFYKDIRFTESIRTLLKKCCDLERCITRINMRRSTPKDLLSIKYTVEIAEQIMAEFVQREGINFSVNIAQIISPLASMHDLHQIIEDSIREDAGNSIAEGKIIKPEHHPKVAELNDLLENGRDKIEQMRDQYRAKTGIDSLKINNNNIIGLFIEVTSRNAGKITDEQFIHRQTTLNSVRYSTRELQALESKMVNAKLSVIGLEQELYDDICRQITENNILLLKLADSLSLLDLYCSHAVTAFENNYCRPSLAENTDFDISGGRHPVVEQVLKKNSLHFTENNCLLPQDERVRLITGPNMAGKSTFLRQNALIAILAQIGSYVPAESAVIGTVDKIFSRIGAGDDLGKGQSTFMLEMLETSAILAQATCKSLIILDEVGRGTSTFDGVAIAWSVLEYIHDKTRARCLFATHYHELTKLEGILPNLVNYTVEIEDKADTVIFLHKIKKGFADKSYGIHVAELAGLPRAVIEKAKDLLQKLEAESTKYGKKLLHNQPVDMSRSEIIDDSRASSKLQKEIEKINPDKLTPKEALDILYFLKSL